ncbi:MAG TPA: DUF4058 family protein [Chloroflexota bacterium]|nr:DUF4058 family protein [Chloroflexota bacterium]
MPTPFPGMDPYLEKAHRWPNIHTRLIVALADDLAAKIRPRYYVSVEERTYLLQSDEMDKIMRPDVGIVRERAPVYEAALVGTAVPAPPETLPAARPITITIPPLEEVRERFLEVRLVEDGRLVTAIEILSPTNKQTGKGRQLYTEKRQAVLESEAHLVEIDLLRAGKRPKFIPAPQLSHYYMLVSRAEQRPSATLFPFAVQQPIPTFRLPLLPGDDEPEVDLGHLLHALYDRAGFDLRIDYKQEPDPPFATEDAAWIDALLKKAGLR